MNCDKIMIIISVNEKEIENMSDNPTYLHESIKR